MFVGDKDFGRYENITFHLMHQLIFKPVWKTLQAQVYSQTLKAALLSPPLYLPFLRFFLTMMIVFTNWGRIIDMILPNNKCSIALYSAMHEWRLKSLYLQKQSKIKWWAQYLQKQRNGTKIF